MIKIILLNRIKDLKYKIMNLKQKNKYQKNFFKHLIPFSPIINEFLYLMFNQLVDFIISHI